ncbi:PH domain-containing protein [Erythrobacter jejuensis]|uniref:PH domain-containing protein n=2 Tax=Parerythrobacter jejuensis TaxID=795812 RepID=A0A845APN5_9SPHN|nr:PH domain-containing protein [Parerythrobacter jejuensis]MXP33591.1 PH domain-containing protein [Parerythrobacter jejuensis]
MIPQLIVPMLFVSYGMADDGISWKLALLPLIVVIFLASVIAVSFLQWRRFTYRVGTTDIKVESGLLSRAARSVPFERIQDVSLEQKFVPRLLGLVEVKFETGAGGKDELKLAYLSEEQGEALRELVRERRDGEKTASVFGDSEASESVPAEQAETLFAMPPKRLVTFGMFEFSLAVIAVIGGLAQQFDFLLPFDIWDWQMWVGIFSGPTEQVAALGIMAQVFGAGLAILSLLALGVVTGVTRTVLRDWGFRLERTSKGFRRRRGLLTRTDVVMPVHRVQAIKVGTGLVRRRFGWNGLSFVSLAQDSGSSSHVVAPFAQQQELDPIIAAAGFESPPGDLDWHRSSTADRNVSMLIDGGVLAFVALVVFALAVLDPFDVMAGREGFAMIPLALGAFFCARQYYLWRHARNAIDADQLYRRVGWLAPSLAIANRVKLQSAEISQGPIARWCGYATLRLGLAGGTFAIEGIPVDRARSLRREVLESIARTDFSALNR